MKRPALSICVLLGLAGLSATCTPVPTADPSSADATDLSVHNDRQDSDESVSSTTQQLNEIQSALAAQQTTIEELRSLLQNQGEILNELKKRSASRMSKEVIQSAGQEDEARVLLKDIQAKIQTGDAQEAQKLMNRMTEQHKDTQFFKEKVVQDLRNELEIIGNNVSNQDLLPHIDQWYVDGQINVESGLTLLVFWERWCPHCKRELPKLNQIQQRYERRGLKLIGLTRMTRRGTDQEAQQFIQDYEIQYSTAKENGEIAKFFRVRGIPTAAVIKDGVVIWRGNLASLNDTIWPSWLEK